jgi:hypothetical protein
LLLALASTVILGSESHGIYDNMYFLTALGAIRIAEVVDWLAD